MAGSTPILIVDAEDHVIGHKLRSELELKDRYRVSALWLTNPDGRILLAQRHPSKKYDAGKWGPAAAGTLEAGDTYESNIRKETEEELGLTGIDFRKGPKQLLRGPHRVFVQWFFATSDWPESRFTLQADEVSAIRWITPDQLNHELKSELSSFVPTAPEWPMFNL